MPIVYMHGVNTRDPDHFTPIREYLRRIVAPAIAPDPENVSIEAADWFQLCPPPKYGGISRPRTILLAAGAEDPAANQVLDAIAGKLPREPVASGGFTDGQAASPVQGARIDKLPDEQLADLLAVAICPPPAAGVTETEADALRRARVGVAADQVARDPGVRNRLRAAGTLDGQLRIAADAVQAEVERQSRFAGAGALGDFFKSLRDRVTESVSRTVRAPGAELTVLASELRPALNDFVTRFLGDLLFYMTRRGTPGNPGPIPSVLMDALEAARTNKEARGGEPVVLLTHSMGGQIAYDTVTSFLPAAKSRCSVDLWCATASQVGFFEELDMFLASSDAYSAAKGNRTPLPGGTYLGHWWNVWDHNDVISFTTKGIFADGIDDEEYWSGVSVAAAHGEYLQRPSFYRQLADKLRSAFPGRSA